ncbi:hypothetical protein BGX33_008922 [Mortierella sp. NVP41]|nr:hypothetical protein BGX33_008922 [Mortierella sp. NVP41]
MKRERLYRSSDGLNSQISINRGSRDGDDDGESVAQSIDNDDLDSEKAFFMANPPGRIRSPQLAHADSHDLNIKTPVEQYEAQKFNWSEPIEISNRHPQNHVRQQQLQRLLELQKEHSQKLNDLVEKYRVQHSRPQSPHSPVLTETRLSTRLSLFGLDGEPLEEEALSSSEIRQLEVKGNGRPELKDAPPFLEEGPFRDHEEVDDDDVELQRLEIYHGPFEDPDDNDCDNRTQSVDMFQDQDEEYDPFEHVGLNDDAIAIAEADFEVASIIRSESGSLTATEFEDRKGKSVQRDSDYSYMGGVSSSSVNDDFRTGFSQRDSDISFLAASSTIGARESYSIRDSDSFMGVTTSAEYGGVGESSSGSGSARSSGIPVALDLERQREREESNILLKAIAAMKAQYDEQYRLIHEGLTGLQLE